MLEWTPSLVEARLAEAADVLKRLPDQRIRGYFNTWPQIVAEFSDLVGQEPPRLGRPPPQPDAISRMEETLSWTHGLDPTDAKIVWLRAGGERWKTICWKVGMVRSAANEHWLYALCVIAWRLNGRRVPGKRSRQHVIATVRSACA
ncbi:MAG: helix-turn-helix domain-containing protein [Bauldia sp.]|nr:helix-turn-helix domain-containing protein [Bauldia sp.]